MSPGSGKTVAVIARTLGHPEVDRGVQQELLGFAKFLHKQMGQQVLEKVMLSARLSQEEGKRFMGFLQS